MAAARQQRPSPLIPDHEVLRKIGGGSYGEVWMARSVTGALRAIKVVWREDFDDERTFEREFEGILKYEPISRTHPSLVNILHVGHSADGRSFYYYVMEIGDDVLSGQEINPVEYEARTLRPDGKRGMRLELDLCIEVGLQLAEALHHLHTHGLAHRDVKPSNIIFVHGKAKLADIGLVAAKDQRTFVGTEGFVPPEGPGSAQADIYSLGKVLYEITTGKDRLDFPDLPDDLPTGSDRKRWLELNQIICEVCDPRISKRKISTAAAMADCLKNLQRGKTPRRSNFVFSLSSLLILSFSVGVSYYALKNYTSFTSQLPIPQFSWRETKPLATEQKLGLLRIVTSPEGAEVFQKDGTFVGITPTKNLEAKVGEQVHYIIKKQNHKSLSLTDVVSPDSLKEPMIIFGKLSNYSPPELDEKWEDHLGIRYLPKDEGHLSHGFIKSDVWMNFLNAAQLSKNQSEVIRLSENGMEADVVLANPSEIKAFVAWFRDRGLQAGYLTENHEVVALIEESFQDRKMSEKALSQKLLPFRLFIRTYRYGTLAIRSEPPGAEVYMNGKSLGKTEGTLTIEKVKPGSLELLFVLEGYKSLTLQSLMGEEQHLPILATLEKNAGVVFGQPWQNSLGMKFQPIQPSLMASAWETRVQDYQVFLRESKQDFSILADAIQEPSHPIVFVSREDAIAFCEWLTQKERKKDFITRSHQYRLPTDQEWSQMAGLTYETGEGPSQRDASKPEIYLWGQSWPPPNAIANFADSSAAALPNMSVDRVIPNYEDGFERTSPVGHFAPNVFGLYDMSGNVQEWVSDNIYLNEKEKLGVLRGASWNSSIREHLKLGWRNPVLSHIREPYYGFRIVLTREENSEESSE